MNNIVTIPNLISFLRLVAGLLFIPLNSVLNFSNNEVIIIILVAWFSDLLDGWVARKMNQISDYGKLIDPVADKVFVFALIITFYISGKVDLIYIAAVIGRDILILLGGLVIKSRTSIVLPSNLLGKICVFSIGIYFLTILFNLTSAAQIVEWISLILILASLIVYFQRAYELVKDINYVHR